MATGVRPTGPGLRQSGYTRLEKSTAGPQPDLLSLATLAHLYSDQGRKAEARRAFQKLEGMPATGPALRAGVRICFGDKTEALDLYRQAIEEHDPHMVWIGRGDPRHPLSLAPEYQEIMRRMNFPR